MQVNKQLSGQRGNVAVEFALILMVFLTMMFALLEAARVLYLWNTLQEVTRHAASLAVKTKFNDSDAMALVRQRAIFRDGPGALVLGAPVTDEYVKIDYLALTRTASGSMTLTPIPTASLPNCTAHNRSICTANPYDASCIRFVRARICVPGSGNTCTPVPYRNLLPLLPSPNVTLPVASTIARVESLGYSATSAQCP